MKIITDMKLLDYYIKKYDIADIFEKDMREYMELHLYERNEQIYRTTEAADYLYFLVKGKFKVSTVQKNGKSLLLRFYSPFEVIGDVELFTQGYPLCNLEVIREVICIGISMRAVKDYCLNDTKFLKYLGLKLSYKLMECSNSSAINLLYPLENRLASYLIAITPDEENLTNVVGFATNKLTDMADFLGTSYRHLNRTIKFLCDKGLIEKQKNFIKILDRKALQSLAGDLYK